MNERTYEEVLDEKSPKIKQLYWDVAFGLQEVDKLKPSKYMKDLSEEHIIGKKTYEQVQNEITSYYSKNKDNHEDDDEEEADEVATAIYEILSDKSFRFDFLTLKNYHRRLFINLDKEKYNAGNFRDYNFTKDEPVLNGDTVQYQSYDLIEETLRYDFEEEEEQDYSSLIDEELIDRITEFTSRIWQVHPFQEGNTRTTAIFIYKYLLSIGFYVNGYLFKNNSLYFRNALVRANYTNYSVGVKETRKYLAMFFENLLLNKDNKLDSEESRKRVAILLVEYMISETKKNQ